MRAIVYDNTTGTRTIIQVVSIRMQMGMIQLGANCGGLEPIWRRNAGVIIHVAAAAGTGLTTPPATAPAATASSLPAPANTAGTADAHALDAE